MGEPFDLVTREFKIGGKTPATAMFVDTIAAGMRVSAEVIGPLERGRDMSTCKLDEKETIEDVLKELLCGKTLVLIPGKADAQKPVYYIADTTMFQARGIGEPPTATVVKGPREGFIENMVPNVSLLRKRIQNPNFRIINAVVGKQTQTKVAVLYMEGLADPDIVDKVVKRIESISIDAVMDSYYILQYLQDQSQLNIFRQVGTDEKPDIVASKLMEGRVAILVDGSPFVLTVPFVLFEDVQNSDDYYTSHHSVSFRRLLRIVGVALAMLLPGLYIAMQLYHNRIVPINTLIIITNSIENSPLSPLLELIFVLILFEIMYEASLRMPRHLGAVTGLIGALVLGGTAVDAGLVSIPAILVVALSGIMMYSIPNLAPQISLLRLFFVLLGGILGLYGLLIGTILVIAYMCSLDSFGAPLLAPYAPLVKSDLKDGIFKTDVTHMSTRPQSFKQVNKRRASNSKSEGES